MLQNSFSKQPVCNVILYPETLNSLQRTGSNLTAWATLGRRDQPPTDIMASTYVADLQEQGRLPAARIAMTERKKAVRVVGKNVQEFIKRETELRERREAVAYTKSKEIYSVWEKTAVRNQAAKARQTLNENRFEEIKQLEVEVKVRRNARLKDYYRHKAEEYDRRLREKGLAYVKDVV